MSTESLPSVASEALAKYQPTDAAIAKLRAEYMPIRVEDVDDKPGAQKAHDARMVVRAHRVQIEKTRVALKADALKFGKAVDTEARRLTEMLEPIEAHLLAQEELVTKEAERRRLAEQARLQEILRSRMVELSKVRSPLIAADVERMDDATFDRALALAQAEHADAQEAEKEAAEQRRIESERLAAERAELDAERLRVEGERKAIDTEKARIAREAELKAAEERAAAKALEDARLKAERDEAERVRREAMRPTVERLQALAVEVESLVDIIPEFQAAQEVERVLARAAQEIRAIAAR